MGSYAKPGICQEDNLRACHSALQGIDIRLQDFRQTQASAGDFVYFDPPYHPLAAAASFTSYVKSGFAAREQVALRDLCLALHRRGVMVMVSNSDAAFIRQLYASAVFKVSVVRAPRMVSRAVSSRRPVNELLITNY